MRKSTTFLMRIPVLFGLTLLCLFIFILSFFKLLELLAEGTTPISEYLPYFAIIIATLIAIDGLLILLWDYFTQRKEETKMERYLAKVDGKESSIVGQSADKRG